MLYDFEALAAHTQSLQTVVNSLESNVTRIKTLRDQLVHAFDFEGAAAEGYTATTTALTTKLDQYNSTLQSLKIAIHNAGLDMQTTDTKGGNSFAGLMH
ncbi:WXG100 family type VII secretion target [Nocardia sp. NPDC006630]|uniref:WXG100 family type VII secretion target n=1 Tax=Nocardia sp. NPDC006630 TaxID=3157181 RepID=UPI00339F2F12